MAAILECVVCHKSTTRLEAESRRFNRGRCEYCNGRLEYSDSIADARAVLAHAKSELDELLKNY